jgi:hypothetical protein
MAFLYVMNSRRFKGHSGAVHYHTEAMLCITAKLIVEWQRWVLAV